jgi:hypothetical protein
MWQSERFRFALSERACADPQSACSEVVRGRSGSDVERRARIHGKPAVRSLLVGYLPIVARAARHSATPRVISCAPRHQAVSSACLSKSIAASSTSELSDRSRHARRLPAVSVSGFCAKNASDRPCRASDTVIALDASPARTSNRTRHHRRLNTGRLRLHDFRIDLHCGQRIPVGAHGEHHRSSHNHRPGGTVLLGLCACRRSHGRVPTHLQHHTRRSVESPRTK